MLRLKLVPVNKHLRPESWGHLPCHWHTLQIGMEIGIHLASHPIYIGRSLIWYHYWTPFFDLFEVKLAFEMLTVRGRQHSFSTHERMFLWKCRRFRDRKCLDPRGLECPTSVFMPNAPTTWAIRARHFLPHVFQSCVWRYRYISSKQLCFDMLIHVINFFYVEKVASYAIQNQFIPNVGVCYKVKSLIAIKNSLPETILSFQVTSVGFHTELCCLLVYN